MSDVVKGTAKPSTRDEDFEFENDAVNSMLTPPPSPKPQRYICILFFLHTCIY